MLGRLTAGLLVLAGLLILASGTLPPDRNGGTGALSMHSLDHRSVAQGERPCEGHSERGSAAGGAVRCQATPCLPACGALPAAAGSPVPSVDDAGRHARAIDEPLRGLSTIPDLPPPRPAV
ncbi:hypothetical protein VY88_22620 [Azospirillum thiophilum]|uniref:hypothetical protein n=1 Tax=Azospirillum thiophilum TaxID=528244 RepID=UPI0005ED6ABF|nr:hypothetical protein [Azospirillum thiophilum]KJR62999.1 hypothetical protein VY88_22620 [Azospirillum thiophilum]